jgi:hypothetical protein
MFNQRTLRAHQRGRDDPGLDVAGTRPGLLADDAGECLGVLRDDLALACLERRARFDDAGPSSCNARSRPASRASKAASAA